MRGSPCAPEPARLQQSTDPDKHFNEVRETAHGYLPEEMVPLFGSKEKEILVERGRATFVERSAILET